MRTHLMRGTAIALALLGGLGFALAAENNRAPGPGVIAQAAATGADPTQSGAEPLPLKPGDATGSPAPLSSGAKPVVNPESTTGLAPADQPVNNAKPNIAGWKVPSSQDDTAAHNPSVFEHDRQPILTHTFNFTKEQKQAISDALAGAKSSSAKLDFEVKETSALPGSVELMPVPDGIGQQMPWVKPYKYVKLGNKILLVDPNYPVIVSIIE